MTSPALVSGFRSFGGESSLHSQPADRPPEPNPAPNVSDTQQTGAARSLLV